ncbi:MAG: TolC family protein [Cyclobacteriaceae bacterium]|nr:TolC family protein [Cyclobacteriaceae bacterium]MCB0498045.1 TolC family protein [Cyclobacteriaceae bacterium]MCB9238769.1 TolC family protein [Flammeovirgaceae bacterium]MCO5270488.1 TolC family protein [Cyclobacteriaceae bacterium]MCW5901071.1 TolC family protein [Cyclobacteriaceae bacterium]
MTRNYILSFLSVFFISWAARAQESEVKTFTLEQCVKYALDNSYSTANAKIDEQIAVAKVRETIGIGLPQVTGSAGITHNQKLSRFFTTYNPNGGFIDLSGVPGIQAGNVVAAQNFFQLKSSGMASLSINQIIFNGSYLVGLQAANAYKELSVKTTDQTNEQVIEQVTKAYYSVLVNRERMKLFDSNINRVDSLLITTRALNENGFAESIDVDRIQVTLNNLKTEKSKFERLQQLSIELLKFQMNYPLGESIEVVGELNEETIDVDLDGYLADWDYKSRPDYQVLETNWKLQNLNIKNNYAAALPSLSANANLGYSTQSPDIAGLFKTNSGISDDGSIGPDKWYSFSSFGLNLNIPLFSGLQRTYRVQQEKLKLRKIENGFKSLEKGIDLEIKQATINYQNSMEALKSQKQNMDLAENVARVTKIKYEQGVGSNLEVVDAESALKEAQVNYYNALFDASISKTDLDKAFGKLLPGQN